MKHILALLAIVNNKTSILRYNIGIAILRIPGRNILAVKTKIFIAGLIADDGD